MDFDGRLDMESEGQEIAGNESRMWIVYLNVQKCHSLG